MKRGEELKMKESDLDLRLELVDLDFLTSKDSDLDLSADFFGDFDDAEFVVLTVDSDKL